jgi:hypothetical protein
MAEAGDSNPTNFKLSRLMLPRQVIVRTAWGEPHKRIAVGCGRGLVQIASDDAPPDATSVATYNVVQQDVFEFDEAAYNAILTAFKLRLPLDGDVWALLKPFGKA